MNLTGTQLQDTYGNVVTIGESAGTPTTGTVQNGAGSDITNLTVNGTVTANLTGDVTGNVSGATTIAGTTVNATTVNATTLTGSGIAISEMPTVCYEWEDAVSAPYASLNNGVNNFIPWNNTRENYPANTTYYELFNSGTSSGGDCARVRIKTAGLYLFQVGVHLDDIHNNVEILVKLMQSANQTGFFPSPVTQGLMCNLKSGANTGEQMLVGSKIINVTANNYFTIAVEPSAHSPYPSDSTDGRTYFQITKLN